MDCQCNVEIIGVLITFLGFLVTLYLLKKNIRKQQIKNILELKQLLENYEDINANLLPTGIWRTDNNFQVATLDSNTKSKLFGYLGFFEICYIMLEAGELSRAEFDTFFSYRLSNVVANNNIMAFINNDARNWSKLLSLIKNYGG